jgi:hypothetical protein
MNRFFVHTFIPEFRESEKFHDIFSSGAMSVLKKEKIKVQQTYPLLVYNIVCSFMGVKTLSHFFIQPPV